MSDIINDPLFSHSDETLQNESDLIARYLMDSHSSGAISNELSSDHEGTLNGSGSPTQVAGVISHALELNGSQYWKLGNDNADELIDFTDGNEWAISLWVNVPSSLSSDAVLVSNPNESGTDFRSFKLWIEGDGTLNAKVTNADGTKTTLVGSTDLRDDSWHHVALVADAAGSSQGHAYIYLDGSEEDGETLNTTRDGNSKEIWLGAYYNSSTGYEDAFSGAFDDVRFYSSKLTQAQARNIYKVGVEGTSTSGVTDDHGWRYVTDGLIACPNNASGTNVAQLDFTEDNSTSIEYTLTLYVDEIFGGSSATVTISINGTNQGSARSLSEGTNTFTFTPTEADGQLELKIDSSTLGFKITEVGFVEAADTTAPTITLTGSSPTSVEVGQSYTDAGATASDNRDGNLTSSIVVAGDTVDTSVVGSYVITYNVTDSAGNAATQVTRTVNVIDSTPPTITLNGNAEISLVEGTAYTEQGASASDNYDGDISGSVVIGGDSVDVSTVGTYVLTYDVTDANGNAATQVTRTVTITAAIQLKGDEEIDLLVGDAFNDAGFDAVDSTGTSVNENVTTTGVVDTSTAGTYSVEYSGTDSSGVAITTVTRTVNVIAKKTTLIPTNIDADLDFLIDQYAERLVGVSPAAVAGKYFTGSLSTLTEGYQTEGQGREQELDCDFLINAQRHEVLPAKGAILKTPDDAKFFKVFRTYSDDLNPTAYRMQMIARFASFDQ